MTKDPLPGLLALVALFIAADMAARHGVPIVLVVLLLLEWRHPGTLKKIYAKTNEWLDEAQTWIMKQFQSEEPK